MCKLQLMYLMYDISISSLQVHYYSETLTTTALIPCRSWHAKALQATVSEGLAKGPYVVARVGFQFVNNNTKSESTLTKSVGSWVPTSISSHIIIIWTQMAR